ncbi:hypothetical protein K474DRAFT_1680999, partial [Panus rudis PR-1116 ss-1]
MSTHPHSWHTAQREPPSMPLHGRLSEGTSSNNAFLKDIPLPGGRHLPGQPHSMHDQPSNFADGCPMCHGQWSARRATSGLPNSTGEESSHCDYTRMTRACPPEHLDAPGPNLNCIARVLAPYPNIQHEHIPLSAVHLSKDYQFCTAFRFDNRARYRELASHSIVLFGPLPYVVSQYAYWSAADLRTLCALHGIITRRDRQSSHYERHLQRHACSEDCNQTLYIFRELAVSRVNLGGAVGPPLESTQLGESPPTVNWLHRQVNVHVPTMPPTTALKREIISDWQQTMDQRQGEQMPCAVCAIKLLSEAVCYVHSKDVDLTLLQNKCIPVAALPRDYNFDAYGQAILHWQGLLNPLSPG